MVQPQDGGHHEEAATEDVNVAFENQQKINKSAQHTSRITEQKEE